ncbi:MAG: diguanylate cyclase [Oscillospiraceae bacterium]|nr:diguanylate cyclase [Oscillospiraceae bacterium]
MRSIRGKFLQLNLISILLCVVLIGGVGLWSISRIQRDSSQDILNLTCRVEGQQLNEIIDSIQASVNLFCEMIDAQVVSPDELKDPQFAAQLCAEAEKSMGKIAGVTRGVCAYYFRLALEITEQNDGFFYSLRPDQGRFVKEPLTDITRYEPTDTEHVGWYYQPKQTGRPLWMAPYLNRNLDVYMVSYVVPLFRDGVFWGLAGMDIDFDVVISDVRAIRAYDSGYAFLCSDSGEIYYHPELPIGSNLLDHSQELRGLLDAFRWETASEAHPNYRYHYNGIGKTLSFFRLDNGMELLLTAKSSEIKAPMVTLFRIMILVALLLCAAVVLVIIPLSNHITRPLQQLTQAARKIALGNLDVELPQPTHDEVGILTRSFEVTVSSLRQYLDNMRDIAFSDPLTHVKNKTAYNHSVLRLQEDIEQGRAAFALVMFDLNDLKGINDRYGHERGDEYIVNCCRLICKVFKHSPIFRTGGDEFVALLEGEDLKSRERLMRELTTEIEKTLRVGEPWQRLSIAKGLAVFSPGDSSPDDVFNRADRAMYADKRRMKGLE